MNLLRTPVPELHRTQSYVLHNFPESLYSTLNCIDDHHLTHKLKCSCRLHQPTSHSVLLQSIQRLQQAQVNFRCTKSWSNNIGTFHSGQHKYSTLTTVLPRPLTEMLLLQPHDYQYFFNVTDITPLKIHKSVMDMF